MERLLNQRYQLISRVGEGGMAHVYRARDTVLDRTVAVKVLREQYAEDRTFVERFRREAQAAANLSHPNVVAIYDVGAEGNQHFIVMEYVEGGSLKDLLHASGPLPASRATEIMSQVCAAIDHAHRRGLVHRDVKPQNILLTESGVVKVTDFGIAKGLSDRSLTDTGVAMGTVQYFSPEQARGESLGPASDIYSAGVVLYEMATGRLPFGSDSAVGVAIKHISEDPPLPSQVNPAVPLGLERVIMRALSKQPEDRFASAADMEAALREIREQGQRETRAVPLVAASRAAPGRSTRTAPPPSPRLAASRVSSAEPGRGPAPPRARSRPGCGTFGIAGLVILGLIGLVPLSQWLLPSLSGGPRPLTTPTVAAVIGAATPTATGTPTVTPTASPTVTPTATPVPAATVPDLKDKTLGQARELLSPLGLTVEAGGSRFDPQIARDKIVAQSVQPGATLERGASVSVTLSAGPAPIALANYTNVSYESARADAERAGLKVDRHDAGSTTVQAGAVIRQVPSPGTQVSAGDTVTLVVSQGDRVQVPDMFKLPEGAARQRLLAVGLKVGHINLQTQAEMPAGFDIRTVPPGGVLSATPDFNSWVERGSAVDLNVRKQDKQD